MYKNIAVNVLKNVFCGEYAGLFTLKGQERILLKQSDKSEIKMSIPISEINYIITMDGKKHSSIKSMKEIFNSYT